MNENKVKSINGVIVKHYLLEALQKSERGDLIEKNIPMIVMLYEQENDLVKHIDYDRFLPLIMGSCNIMNSNTLCIMGYSYT